MLDHRRHQRGHRGEHMTPRVPSCSVILTHTPAAGHLPPPPKACHHQADNREGSHACSRCDSPLWAWRSKSSSLRAKMSPASRIPWALPSGEPSLHSVSTIFRASTPLTLTSSFTTLHTSAQALQNDCSRTRKLPMASTRLFPEHSLHVFLREQ